MTLSLLWLKTKLFFGWRPKIKRRELVAVLHFTKEQLEKHQSKK